jgi:mitochondrial import inner membrane translocase subunit TIM22
MSNGADPTKSASVAGAPSPAPQLPPPSLLSSPFQRNLKSQQQSRQATIRDSTQAFMASDSTSIYQHVLSRPPLTSTLYTPQQAFHRPVPIKGNETASNPLQIDVLTRTSLPYFLPWNLTAGPPPNVMPPDASWFTNSCVLKCCIGTLGGGMMGLLMGVFLGALADTTPPVQFIGGKEVPQAPIREQMKVVLRSTRDKSLYWARNFAFLTGVFGATECLVEKYRAKHDVWNAVASGCATGALLQAKQGPSAAAFGCAGFAGFSLVIDQFMETH